MRIQRLKAEDLREPQMSVSERMDKRQHWPKNQEAAPTPDSHGFVAQAYEDALVLEAMPSRFRGMASVFGLFMLAVFAQVASRLSMIIAVTASGAAKGDYWVVFLGVLLVSFMLALMLLTLVSAVRIFRIDLLAPKQIPMVFLTSNNTRELSEALKRRCLFLHIDYPESDREKEIVRVRVPEIDAVLADQIAKVVGSIRKLDIKKAPSISETIDWARTLVYLGRNEVTPEVLGETLHVLLKYQSDIAKARKELGVDAPASIRK